MSSLASEVKVANLALTGLGADRIISLTEDSENARKVNAIFELMRDEVLRAHPWNFAVSRREFNQTTNTPLYGYTSEFQIPGDVLRIIKTEDKNLDFLVEGDKVLANTDSMKCLCINRITDPTRWDAAFVTCFAARLEAELAYGITDSRTIAQDKWSLYLSKLRDTKAYDAQEGEPEEFEADEWLDSRFSGVFWKTRIY